MRPLAELYRTNSPKGPIPSPAPLQANHQSPEPEHFGSPDIHRRTLGPLPVPNQHRAPGRGFMDWLANYRRKIVPLDEAVQCIQSNMRVYIHPGCAEPEELVEALMARAPFVKNVEIVHLLTVGRADYIAPQMEGHFRHNAMFIGGNVRQAINEGRADYTPVFLSQVEDLFESDEMPIDVALIQVSPPDAHGFCSFGVGVDATLGAARYAKFVLAQVNDQMPRTFGDSFIHVR